MIKQIKDLIDPSLGFQQNWKLTLLKNWHSIIGDLKEHVRIEKIQKESITLGVYDSSWLQELYLLSNILLKNINDALDKPFIKKLHFKAAAKRKKIKKRVIPKKPTLEKPVKLSTKELVTLKKIEDEDLRNALKNYLVRCYKER